MIRLKQPTHKNQIRMTNRNVELFVRAFVVSLRKRQLHVKLDNQIYISNIDLVTIGIDTFFCFIIYPKTHST